jgi:pimeloyl-ACP methyl ester carboxylesterase
VTRHSTISAAAIALSIALNACAANEAAPLRIAHDHLSARRGDPQLAATISYPDDDRRHPAVVTVHGSGRIGRDETRFEWSDSSPKGSSCSRMTSAALAAYDGPNGLDTSPLLEKLRTPTLWLLGEHDESIPIRQTQQTLRRAVAAGATITVKTYEDADHGLRTRGGSMAPYWDDTLAWLRARRFLP